MERIVHYERSHIDEPVIEDNVLITSISKKVPLVKAVRSAAEKLNPSIRIIGADASADVVARGFVDHFWHCWPAEQWDFDYIAQYCRENSINAIIPTRDAELPFFAKHLDDFAKAGMLVMVSCEDTVSLCSDKLTFYKNLSAFGINSVETSEAAEEIKGTIVVKERWGSGSQYVYVDCDLDSAKSFAAKLEAPIFQPCVKGREFSTDFYVDKEGKLKGVVSRWRTKIVAGESQVTETFHSLEIEDIVGRLADKFLFFGHCVLQGFVDSLGKIHILEVNTRFGGASPLSIAAGLDSFYWFLLEANGQPVGEYPFFRVLDELKLVRYPADVIQSSNSDINAASSKTSTSNEMALSYLEPADSPARR
jgi:carbamoyl-phosphate synthase large subunit